MIPQFLSHFLCSTVSLTHVSFALIARAHYSQPLSSENIVLLISIHHLFPLTGRRF